MHPESVLEFEELRALLGRYVRSPLGRAELERLEPSSDRAEVEESLAELAEAVSYLEASSQPQPARHGAAIRLRFDLDTDPAAIIGRLRIEGTTLEAQEIRELARFLDVSAAVRSLVLSAAERFPRLAALAGQLADLRRLGLELTGKILPDGSLTDDASVVLRRLRRDAERQRKHIEDSLQRFLRAHHEDGTLQEEFVTIRNDRWVVPVVTGRERRVDGVIHGSSGSGQTVFVEPLETIALNNELVRLREEELREVHRLLREFTARLREHAATIAGSAAAMGRLELLFVKAEFARDFRCCVPRLGASRPGPARILLREARHPLLADILRKQGKTVVPMSVVLEDQRRTLLISGPNTGGKTVALKTVGLLAIMTQAGLPVPAEEAEFPLFDQVLADIGDRQSLAESLSSFSAHIVTVGGMLERATGDSLVLLDELGRATDPEEGGALGVTIVEAFRRRGAFTLASTHLTAMKVYGASTAHVVNGSMGFDDETLQPTYMLRLGAPGKSAGLEIASRLGLDAGLIDEARSRMGSSERDVAQFLARLNQQLEDLESERVRSETMRRQLEAREHDLEASWERRYKARIAELERQAAEAAERFEQHAEQAVRELSQRAGLGQKAGIGQKARARIAKTSREYREEVSALAPQPPAGAPPRLRIEAGARVRLKGIRQPATVRRVRDDGSIDVEAGYIKMQVAVADVDEVLPPSEAPARPAGIRFNQSSIQGPSWDGGYREIKLIGQHAEEARELVDKFLDTAALAQVERVRIIHGHGMGVLKRTVAELLAGSPHVEKFYPASPEEGGEGATIAELKS